MKATFSKSIFKNLFAAIILGILCSSFISNEVEDQDDSGRWKIHLSTKSLERVLLAPETILQDPDAFWLEDEAYVLASQWHRSTGISKDHNDYYQKWLEYLKELSEIPENDRKTSEGFLLAQEIIDRIPKFMEYSVPLLDDFSPKNDLTFETTVHITHRTLSFDFMTNGQIVCDPLSPYFEKNPDKMMNLLTHECFHIAYGYNRRYRKEEALENSFIYSTLLDGLQNEGMATYIGYMAREFFPSEGDKDYEMLDDPTEVKRHLHAINDLYSQASEMPVDSLRPKAWQIGVMDRGYYILGAHMSRMIEKELGRNALVETIEYGPVYFVETYNKLVPEEEMVYTFN